MNNLFSSVHWCRNVSRYLGTSDVLDDSAPNCSLVRNVLCKVLRHSVTLWCPLLPYGYSCPVPDRVKPSFVFLTSGYSDAQGWASVYPNVKKYKWRLNPVWHRMLYSCIHMATMGVEGLKALWRDMMCLQQSLDLLSVEDEPDEDDLNWSHMSSRLVRHKIKALARERLALSDPYCQSTCLSVGLSCWPCDVSNDVMKFSISEISNDDISGTDRPIDSIFDCRGLLSAAREQRRLSACSQTI